MGKALIIISFLFKLIFPSETIVLVYAFKIYVYYALEDYSMQLFKDENRIEVRDGGRQVCRCLHSYSPIVSVVIPTYKARRNILSVLGRLIGHKISAIIAAIRTQSMSMTPTTEMNLVAKRNQMTI